MDYNLMMNYDKSTLNLPYTKFPMRGNLVQQECKILTRWIHDDLYQIIRKAKQDKEIFILHDGPPYANGKIHIGHAVNKILKDIIIKYKVLTGFNAHYVPGWDCHGLPVELQVERKYGKPGENITAAEFRIKCREYVISQINCQRKDFIRLGILGDWSNPYLTMDFKTEANIIRSLAKIIKNDYLYRGNKPVYWCIKCCSSLSEAEVEYYNQISPSLDIAFDAVDQKIIRNKFGIFNDVVGVISLVIWTTTPWTLTSSRAIALAPELKYALVQIKNRALIIAKDLVKSVMQRIQVNSYMILGIVKGAQLELMYFKHPFLKYTIPVILGDYITLDMGTGAVHTAGSYGIDDYHISLKYGLEIVNQIESDGSYMVGTHPSLDGINIFKSKDIIVNLLYDNQSLLHIGNIKHNYPFCWRHKSPIIFRSTPQWFINMDNNKLREKSLEAIQNVQWVPHWCKSRIKSMITNRPDWCISRQRVWGVPMSLFVHKKTHKLHPRTLELMEEVAKRVETDGIQAWWDLNLHDILGKDAVLYDKVLDTLDVWFDSGSTHTSVINMRPECSDHTIDMYLEGSDQYRGWFMSSLIISMAISNMAPYRTVLTHGFTVDGRGYKMSKSAGNTISPQDIVSKLGADILRLWVASTDYTSEMTVSNEILKRISDSYRRIRNTARFLLANISDFNPKQDMIQQQHMVALDRWAINCAQLTQMDIITAYESYDFHKVVQRLMRFCSVEMGSFYLDIIKDRQYTTKVNGMARRSSQTALYHITEAFVRWIAPIMSFTADEIWEYIPGDRSKYVFTTEWYGNLFHLNTDEIMNDNFWHEIIKVRSEVNKIIEQERINKTVYTSLEIAVIIYADQELAAKLSILGEELKFVLLTSSVKIMDYTQATSDAKQSELFPGLKISLRKAMGKRCKRCWHYTTDIGQIAAYKEICRRCIYNIVGSGEERKFA